MFIFAITGNVITFFTKILAVLNKKCPVELLVMQILAKRKNLLIFLQHAESRLQLHCPCHFRLKEKQTLARSAHRKYYQMADTFVY